MSEVGEFAGSVLILAVGAILIITLLGGDASGLIELLPNIVLFAVVLALALTLLRVVIN